MAKERRAPRNARVNIIVSESDEKRLKDKEWTRQQRVEKLDRIVNECRRAMFMSLYVSVAQANSSTVFESFRSERMSMTVLLVMACKVPGAQATAH